MSNTATREEILKDAPDFVQIATKYMQDIYVEYEKARRRVDECQDRFITYKGANDVIHSIDLKYLNFAGLMRSRGASEESIADAKEIRVKVIMPLLSQYNQARQKYMNAFDLYNTKTKALAKLTPTLLNLFGSMYSIKDVQKTIKKREGYDLDEDDLRKFYNENKTLIESRQMKFALKSDKYRIATEAGRLEIINDILTDFQLKYEESVKKEQDSKALTYSREIRNLIEQARKEVKGNELKLTVDGKIDINATLHGQENVGRIMRDIPINSIIVGLVAAKSGIRPEILVNQLATSWYKDFNGFSKNILGQEEIQLPGDLIKTYDWDELREKNKRFLDEMKPIEIQDVTYEEVVQDKRKRNALKEKLRLLNK